MLPWCGAVVLLQYFRTAALQHSFSTLPLDESLCYISCGLLKTLEV
jgi:hypothetical protein